MKKLSFSVSVCRYCGHYQPEGQRGGHCKLLDVPVRGCWESCPLCISPFDRNSKHLGIVAISRVSN